MVDLEIFGSALMLPALDGGFVVNCRCKGRANGYRAQPGTAVVNTLATGSKPHGEAAPWLG